MSRDRSVVTRSGGTCDPESAAARTASLEGWIGGDSRLEWITGRTIALTGYSAAELMEMDRFPEVLVHPEDRAAVIDLFAGARSGRADDLDVRLVRKEGSLARVRVDCEPVFRRDGRADGFRVLLEEISSPSSPAELAETETETLDSARLETLGRLAQRVAHDCNNLLMVVLGHADLILATAEGSDGSGWASVREDSDQACRATRAAGDLMRHLLDYARATTDETDQFEIDQVVKDLAVVLRIVVPKSVALVIEGPFPAVTVAGNVGEIRQLITQLVLDAVDGKRSPNGRVIVRLLVEELTDESAGRFEPVGSIGAGRAAIIEVEDRTSGERPGAGRTFDLVSSPTIGARRKGLATVLRIASRNRAGVEVATTATLGTRFRIGFPAPD